MDKRAQLILFAISFFGIISVLLSCEKDDICTDVDLTPFLIVNLVQQEDPDELETVVDLQVEYIGDGTERITAQGDTIIDINRLVFDTATSTDSITLLLPTFKDSAIFVFKQNFDENDSLSVDTEVDTISFFYDRSNEYVNRACGFRTVYSDLRTELVPGANNFIRNVFIDNTTIEDEEEAHIRLSH